MSTTTANTSAPIAGDLLEGLKTVEALLRENPPKWTLNTPDGRLWHGTQREIARVVFRNIDVSTLFSEGQSHE